MVSFCARNHLCYETSDGETPSRFFIVRINLEATQGHPLTRTASDTYFACGTVICSIRVSVSEPKLCSVSRYFLLIGASRLCESFRLLTFYILQRVGHAHMGS